MAKNRRWFIAAGLIGLGSGLVGLCGCGGKATQTGTMVEVDLAKEKAHQDQMTQFYGSPSKKPGK